MTQEFHISITPMGQDTYLVRTEQVAPEVPLAEELVTWSVEDWLTEAARLNNDLQGDGQSLVGADADNIVNLGQQLYKALFQGSIRDSWLIAQEIAQSAQEVLQLRLSIKEPILARLPWGILHTGDYFLANNPFIIFADYQADLPVDVHSPQLGNFAQNYTDELLPAPELGLLGEEDWEEKIDVEDDDPTYEEDSALISDLFRQLNNKPAAVESVIPSSNLEQPPEVTINALQSGTQLPHSKDKSNLAASPIRSGKSLTAPDKSKQPEKLGFPRRYQNVQILPIIQAVGVTAIALIGFWRLQGEPQKNSFPIPQSQQANTNLNASNSELEAIAIKSFNNGNLSAGSLAVEELLNRGALQSADTALKEVSDLQAKTSTINFLRGRLAWQSIKVGDKNYSLDAVRRYWETAVKSQPDSPKYHNALAFVYYIQGDLNQANQTWFQALYLVAEQDQTATSTPTVTKRDQLNAYAGLALVLSKSAQNQPSEKAKFLNEAIKLRRKVLTEDPVNFQPQTLSKTWLWTDKAIQDWRSLLKLEANS